MGISLAKGGNVNLTQGTVEDSALTKGQPMVLFGEFMKAMQVALALGMDQRLRVDTPLMWLDKAATWQLAHELGQRADAAGGGAALVALIAEHTHSCYAGQRATRHPWGYGCGHCPACELRAQGWARWSSPRAPAN